MTKQRTRTMELNSLLEQFRGKTPDEIAAMVKRRGIKGRMGTTYGCPMALLLNGVDTGQHVIGRRFIVRASGKLVEKVRTPLNVAQFVRKFDIGGYPELVAPPPRCLAKPSSKRTYVHHKNPNKPPKYIKNHIAKLVDRFGQGVPA